MSRFLVGPPSETAWTLDPEALTLRLRATWPQIEVTEQDPESLASLAFRVPVDGEYPPLVHLLTPGHTVTLEGGLAESAEFAAWLRGIAPPEQPLLFYDQGYSFDVTLTPGITRDEIVSAAQVS